VRSRIGPGSRPVAAAALVLGLVTALTVPGLAAAAAAQTARQATRHARIAGRPAGSAARGVPLGGGARAVARARRAGRRGGDYRRACAVTRRPSHAACMALIRTDVRQQAAAKAARQAAPPSGVGYGPSSLQSAYKLPSAAAGSGQTVAIVDADSDPDAAANLAAYRAAWGLPACGTGCLRIVNQNGHASPLPGPARSSGWATEESLDLDLVSAACPKCSILLVEAASPGLASLGTAVNTAVRMGAVAVSNSYGASESAADPGYDTSYYRHTGVAITASAGDSGYGVSYPAASRYVTSVGGTTLTKTGGQRGWTETAWGMDSGQEGTGSGCSAYEVKPSWQTDTGCARRTDNDVAAVADPDTGVAVYDSYDEHGWLEVGGTSAGAPLIASVYALAGSPAAGSYPASYPYSRPSGLYDITSGTNGRCGGSYLCTAQAGYDGPTGLGTPDGTAAFSSAPAGARCPARQLLANRGFERGGPMPWASSPGVVVRGSDAAPAQSGSWLAWLDGYGEAHTDILTQAVTIPAGCRRARLSFWLKISSTDPAGRAYDSFTVQIVTAHRTVTLATYSNQDASARYIRHVFSLRSLAGQSITVKFTGREELTGHDTSFFEDGNALIVS